MFVSQVILKDIVCWASDGPWVLVAGETSPLKCPQGRSALSFCTSPWCCEASHRDCFCQALMEGKRPAVQTEVAMCEICSSIALVGVRICRPGLLLSTALDFHSSSHKWRAQVQHE